MASKTARGPELVSTGKGWDAFCKGVDTQTRERMGALKDSPTYRAYIEDVERSAGRPLSQYFN